MPVTTLPVTALPVAGVPATTLPTAVRPDPLAAPVPAPDPLAVVGDDLQTSLPDGRQVRFANLDYAASAPCVRAAADAVNTILPWYGSVHRGAGARSVRCTEAYEQARRTVAGFLGCRPGDQVVFTRNTPDSVNLLARALPPGTVTLTFDAEHHATLLPWPRPVRLTAPDTPEAAVTALDTELGRLRTRLGRRTPILVAVTGASNVTGEVWPVAALAAVAHGHGARLAVDAAQLAPHEPVDLARLGADYLALSGHKLYAPFGAGVLAGRADWLDAARPYLLGGGASGRVGPADGDVDWVTGAARHEAGTPNLLGAVALAAVCEALDAADRDALRTREQALLARLRTGLASLPSVVELRLFGRAHPGVGIVSVALPHHDAGRIAERLGREHGVGVRAGLFCAHPLTRRLLSAATGMGAGPDLGRGDGTAGTGGQAAALRASIGLGTTISDVDRLVDALADLTTR